MKGIIRICALTIACGGLLVAQVEDGQRPEPNYEEAIAHLGLSDSQVDCLESNQSALREALAPSIEQLRDLQRQLREAARNGEDTTGIKAEIESVRSGAKIVKTGFVTTAQSCLDSGQFALLNELVAAETLMNEVRQGAGLLLLEPTEEKPQTDRPQDARGRRGRR